MPHQPTVAVVSIVPLVREALEEIVEIAPDFERWNASSGEPPAVVLYAAASAAGLRRCKEQLPQHARTSGVLYDLEDQLGPAGAGLNRLRGYLPGSVGEDRLLRCLRRVATGHIDAPGEHIETLLRVLGQPALDATDLQILQLLAWGRSHEEIMTELDLPKSTFESYLGPLMRLFDAASGHHLGAVAQRFGLVASFEEEPPDLPLAELIHRPRKRRQ